MSSTDKNETIEYLDEDEKDLIDSLENEEWISVPDKASSIIEAEATARATLRKDQRMNIRISERDLRGIKARAAEEGIPYQTLVTMVLHKYVAGRMTEKGVNS